MISMLISAGLNGGAGHIWDLLSGSFSPSPSPVFSSLASASADQRQLLLELDEAKRKIKQCEEAWHQIKQVRQISIMEELKGTVTCLEKHGFSRIK